MLQKFGPKDRDNRGPTSGDTKPRHSSKPPSKNIQSKSKDLATTSFSDQYFPVSRNFFLLLGPDTWKEESANVSKAFSSARGNYCRTIGDGERTISLNEVQNSFKDFVSIMNRNSPRAKECCIILHAHGVNHHGFRVKLEDRSWLPIEELFKIFSSVKDRYHISIFITSCYGGSVHHSLGSLPVGSSVVTISDGTSIESDIKRWINSVHGNWEKGASILNLLNGFLIHGLQNRHYPRLSIVGIQKFKLNDIFIGHLGKQIQPKVVQSLEKRYKTREKLLGSIVDKIHNARNE